MPITINSNMAALLAINAVNNTTKSLATSLQRLASGVRINSAKDDPGGLAIASKMISQIRGSNQALRNTNDAISLTQVADDAMAETTSNLQRMRELAVQASNATYLTADRANMNLEFQSLSSEILRVAQETKYNSIGLLMGSFTGKMIQIGPMSGDLVSLTFLSATPSGVGVSTDTSLGGTDGTAATLAITLVDNAITSVSNIRATIGALQSRLSSSASNLTSYAENMTVANGNVMDADISLETSKLARNAILQQMGVAVIAQANLQAKQVLNLLGGS
ncbi:MAG: flagellin FliC [Magnetococcales bacterium]|nr:flagellin FliC [Magnetococcales bacterium]